jgi:ABC-type transporter Mla subunit MlaD
MQERTLLGEVRDHRAELQQSMSAVEQALAGAAGRNLGAWAGHVQAALDRLSAAFRDHVAVTEGRGGLYDDIQDTAPRLAGEVDRLTREHGKIAASLADLLERAAALDGANPADVAELRQRGTVLLGTLSHHRQRGADLVYDAYEVDLGGET